LRPHQYDIIEHQRPRHLLVKGTSASFELLSTIEFSEEPG